MLLKSKVLDNLICGNREIVTPQGRESKCLPQRREVDKVTDPPAYWNCPGIDLLEERFYVYAHA